MITLEKIKLYHKNTIMLIKELKEEWYLLQIELMLLDISNKNMKMIFLINGTKLMILEL